MTIDISNNAARVNYTVAFGVTQTSFSVPFEFFNDSDLSVYLNGVLQTITTHYTVSGGDGSTGTVTTSVTGVSGGSTVVISRSIAIERTSDFQTGVDINRAALNTQLDTLTAIAADNEDKASRSISAPNSEVNPVLELPDADTRKGKLIGFNETSGNVELSATLADGNTLASISSDIATLADIEDGTDATDAIQTAASISSDITTAASNITEIQNASANAATATTKAAEAATSASNAATSATNASTSETNAATSETNAATSASTATTQAGISINKAAESTASAASALASKNSAATSESNASTSESNASNSATLSEASRIASVAAQAAAETAETNAETAQTAAETAETNAAASETAAATSETNASTSAATATTQAGIATTKASEASASEVAAEAAKVAAEAALDEFTDIYLGAKASDPTTDNDGNALTAGDQYFNTTTNILKIYNGSSWQSAAIDSSGFVETTGDTMTGALDVQSTITADGLNLDAISETISDTAVDVFVYDTSKDSDGGAWRKRTQGTSWYNEAASATRGSRKEFPAVAVIVVKDSTVTIYDGDDPDLPMWMVFNAGTSTTSTHIANANKTPSSISMLNGDLCLGFPVGGWGVSRIGFLSDSQLWYWSSAQYRQVLNTISERNSLGAPGNGSYYQVETFGLVNAVINDVAMTVLPNAPIDAATGLSRVTTAVATNSGVSVIKDDGTVVDLTYTVNGTNESGSVNFTEGNGVAWSTRNLSGTYAYLQHLHSIPASDYSSAPDNVYERDVNTVPGYNGLYMGKLLSIPNGYAAASTSALTLFNENKSLTAAGMNAYVTSSYATGWMNGAIKLATLSDTDDTNVTGSELVTNGTFASDSNWTKGSNWSIANGVATTTGANSASASRLLSQTNVLTVGETYTLSVHINGSNVSANNVYLSLNGPSTNIRNVTSAINSTFYITFVATTTTLEFTTSAAGNYSGNFSIDNVSVRLASEIQKDRSVNGNGLQVFGTVTKNPVATGADLVAYGPFTNANYLAQPHNSDLNFGTGDFCIMGWFKLDSNSGSSRIVYRQQDTSNSWTLYSNAANLWFYQTDGTATYSKTSGTHSLGVWNHIVVRRTNALTDFVLNGVIQANDAGYPGTTARDATFTSPLYIGRDPNNSGTDNVWGGSLALIRISATIPSPEQIKKIYEDEKVLFQENAQATLYGSSDAVTALAYDDSTELLHVGTSAGRSVFQGVRRVDNTTDAVGAAISASNGLVAED